MRRSDITATIEDAESVSQKTPVPILMIVHSPPFALTRDRVRLHDAFTVGRNFDCHLAIEDGKVSGIHFRISVEGAHCAIEDLGSTNGTYLDGERLTYKRPLYDNAVIRIGRTVLVFHGDGREMLHPPPRERYGMVGTFHLASILKRIAEAAFSREHLLITGPTGTGKELAARAVHAVMSRGNPKMPYVTHNAACFANDDEAASTLLGIADRAFTNVAKRPGLIEQADGGVLFLDEIHNYTIRVQRTLLRLIEDRKYSRIGDPSIRTADVRFLFASNEPKSIAPDLAGRLRHSLALPPLAERRADIPSIFNSILKTKLESYAIAEAAVLPHLKAKHYELLCLDAFEEYNIRGIKHLADMIATKIGTGTPPEETVDAVFSEQFPQRISSTIERNDPSTKFVLSKPPLSESKEAKGGSKYERNKDLIIEQFNDRDQNISSTTRALERFGLKCSRRHVREYLKKWGVIS